MKLRTKFYFILLLAAVALIIAYPKEQLILKRIGVKSNLQVERGLDLRGGVHLAYQADLSGIPPQDRASQMAGLIKAIEKRINPGGAGEVIVQRAGEDRVIVEQPDIKDPSETIKILGQKSELTFLEILPGDQVRVLDITGKDVEKATADFPQGQGTLNPVVRLKMKGGASTKKFADITSRINQDQTRMATLLNGQPIFGPANVDAIIDGNAQLSGDFDIKKAKEIADLINQGALPVPITLGEQRTVGPTLGQEAVAKSLIAALIGLTVLAAFMVIYYRLAGAVAVAALVVYSCLMLSYFKLSTFIPGGWFIFSPIVLTLAGIAGFILSIGMAVDANILIFERMKEELRSGKNFAAALEAGFDRAWTSIRDSNVTTLISTVILYNFGSTIIKGFAVTLAIGVLISMFTAIVVSRTFLRMLIRTNVGRNPALYGIKGIE